FTYLQDRLEGNFRWSHVRLRCHAESIAFYGATEVEIRDVQRRFKAVIGNQNRIMWLRGLHRAFAYFFECAATTFGCLSAFITTSWWPSEGTVLPPREDRVNYYFNGVAVSDNLVDNV